MHLKLKLIAAITSYMTGQAATAYIDVNTPPMSRQELMTTLQKHPEVTQLNQVPGLLREDFLMNFVLKHGIKRVGERGHLVETDVSQSADPGDPRAIIFDERSGFSVSYNRGAEGQTAGQRLDVLSFNSTAKTFSLEQIDFPIQPGKPVLTTSDCVRCHGPNMRPIFSMYPDWPAFYGSDNDELTGPSAVEKAELNDYLNFRSKNGRLNPRYAPLYDDARVKRRLGIQMYPSFPFRQDTSEVSKDISRAFAFRPSLRIGIVYNRLLMQQIFNKISTHRNYPKYAKYFLYNILECTPKDSEALHTWHTSAAKTFQKKPMVRQNGLLEYGQLLSLFNLKINDVDMRYSYNHSGYENTNAKGKVMAIGYIGNYYNSYFDGSATANELLAASIYSDVVKKSPKLEGLAKERGLEEKYTRFTARFKFDKIFFQTMDKMGKWISMPYPEDISKLHHRETFTEEMKSEYEALCTELENNL